MAVLYMAHRDPNKLYPHDYALKYVVIPWIPKWIIPNHITVARFILTPFVVWGLAIGAYEWAVPFFLLVAFTDVVDGSLARVRDQVTEWGSVYDPVADKILISLAAIVVITAAVGWWLAILVILFEIAIVVGAFTTGELDKNHKRVIMANPWGKSKMAAQVLGVLLLLIALMTSIPLFVTLGTIVLIVALVLAIMSVLTHGI